MIGPNIVLEDGPHNSKFLGFIVARDDRVKAILLAEGIMQGAVGGHHADAEDTPALNTLLLEKFVEIDRLMGAVEPPDPDVADMVFHVTTILRGLHIFRQAADIFLI